MINLSQRLWLDPFPVEPSLELIKLTNGSRLAAELLTRRGINDPVQAKCFLFPEYYTPAPPTDFPGMEEAAACILDAIRKGKEICVWGDFDVDGQTSTTILVSALRKLNARVRHYIPNREMESHGVHLEPLKNLIESGIQLLLTCDTGITAVEETAWARTHGVDVVITDHHELPDALPKANAIINPRLLPPEHPLYPLPGCGVAYKLAEELLTRAGMPEFAQGFLDLAALGIVADVAELCGEARYLLQLGLNSLRDTQRVGLKRLYASAKIDASEMNEQTISFALSPRLNALGRLDDANPIVDFFTTTSNTDAVVFAGKLEGLNEQRRMACDQVYKGAMAQIEAEPVLLNTTALVLSHPDWPAGVIGIAANRLVDRYHRPVILFNAPVDGIARGSARSIPGINITEAIKSQNVKLSGFGGHPMAAGLSLPANLVPDFRQSLSYTIREMTAGVDLTETLSLDAILPLVSVTHETIAEMNLLSPFGNGNPAPVLMSPSHRVVDSIPIGGGKDHIKIIVEDLNGKQFVVLRWNGADLPIPEGTFDLAYNARTSSYKGEPQINFEWVDSRPTLNEKKKFASRNKLQVDDLRGKDPIPLLSELMAQPDTIVWGEGFTLPGVKLLNRTELRKADNLIIAFNPPGAEAIKEAISKVRPGKVILLSCFRSIDDADQLLQNLMMTVKHNSVDDVFSTSLQSLAGLTGQRSEVIHHALEVFALAGQLLLEKGNGSTVVIRRGNGIPDGDTNAAMKRLKAAQVETVAFQRHFASAPLEDLRRDYFKE